MPKRNREVAKEVPLSQVGNIFAENLVPLPPSPPILPPLEPLSFHSPAKVDLFSAGSDSSGGEAEGDGDTMSQQTPTLKKVKNMLYSTPEKEEESEKARKKATATAKAAVAKAADMSPEPATQPDILYRLAFLCALVLEQGIPIQSEEGIKFAVPESNTLLEVLDEIAKYNTAKNIQTTYAFNPPVKEGKTSKTGIYPKRAIGNVRSELRFLAEEGEDESSDWGYQVLSGYDALTRQVTAKIMLSNKWERSRTVKDECGRSRAHHCFSRLMLSQKKEGDVRAAPSSTNVAQSLRALDHDSSPGWPCEGLFIPTGILTALLRSLPQLLADYKDATTRMRKIVEANPESVRQWEATAKTRGNLYYTAANQDIEF